MVSESAKTYSSPPRARTSCMFDFSFSSNASLGAMVTTGIWSVTSANGPCFSSPAAKASAWMYEISFSFKAPSRAIGKCTPRPRKRAFSFCARTSAQAIISGSSASTLVSEAGRLRSCARKAFSCDGAILPRCFANAMASRKSPTNCVVKAFVEATPISVPARVR